MHICFLSDTNKSKFVDIIYESKCKNKVAHLKKCATMFLECLLS